MTLENLPELAAIDEFQFSGRGEIYSYTVVERDHAPADYKKFAPYKVAIIKLEEGPLITAQLTDLGDIKPEIGMAVEMVTRKLKEDGEGGILVYGYKFRPLLEKDS
jgi:hypothetical protein